MDRTYGYGIRHRQGLSILVVKFDLDDGRQIAAWRMRILNAHHACALPAFRQKILKPLVDEIIHRFTLVAPIKPLDDYAPLGKAKEDHIH